MGAISNKSGKELFCQSIISPLSAKHLDYNAANMPTNPVSLLDDASMSHNQYVALGLVQSTNIPWYLPSIPQPLQPHIQHFFENYVGLETGEVIPHIESVVRIAFKHLL